MKQIQRHWKGNKRGWDILSIVDGKETKKFVKTNPIPANPMKQKNGMQLLKNALSGVKTKKK